jgi:uncharacterized protein YlxW (UPF0749 family)
MLAISPLRIYNDTSRPKHIRKRPTKANDELNQLRQQVVMYKRERAKLKKLAEWNLRSTKSSLKDVQETLEILEDLYGDEMYEDQSGYDR